jgi:hypothetical protein
MAFCDGVPRVSKRQRSNPSMNADPFANLVAQNNFLGRSGSFVAFDYSLEASVVFIYWWDGRG